MPLLSQKLVPGIVGISTYVDFVYQKEMQLAAAAAAGTDGPINQLRSVTVTLDFNRLVVDLREGRKGEAEEQVAVAVTALAAAGADFVVVTSGTTSTLTAQARQRASLPYLDLAAACFRPKPPPGPVGLLATSYAAKAGFFQDAARHHGLALIVPDDAMARRVDDAIFGELVRGSVSAAGLQVFHETIDGLVAGGAASIVLGNTDLALVADALQAEASVPLVDSARAHARDAARAAMSGTL